MNTRHHLRIVLMALALFFALGAGDTGQDDSDDSSGCGGEPPPLLQDPSFDLWCGDELCSWEVDEGRIAQVPTWHQGDHGVGMLSDPTVISQKATGTADDTHCIFFTLMVATDPGVTVALEIDFQDNGLTEYAHPIPNTDWTTFSYHIRPPEWFDTLRFRIRKTGVGNATVAQIMADRADEALCESQVPTPYDDLPLGSYCASASECATGICEAHQVISHEPGLSGQIHGSCGECTPASCDEGQVCGLAFTDGNLPYSACIQPSAKALGEACIDGGECGSAVCCEGRCSECCTDGHHACADEGTCTMAPGHGNASTLIMPWMCDPRERDRLHGERCMQPGDCASATCVSQRQLMICDPSGQPCERDADCPEFAGESPRCATLGPYDGVCLMDEPSWSF